MSRVIQLEEEGHKSPPSLVRTSFSVETILEVGLKGRVARLEMDFMVWVCLFLRQGWPKACSGRLEVSDISVLSEDDGKCRRTSPRPEYDYI